MASVLALASVAFAYRPTPLRMALPRADVLRPFQEGRALKVGEPPMDIPVFPDDPLSLVVMAGPSMRWTGGAWRLKS